MKSLQDLATLSLGLLAKGGELPSDIVIRVNPLSKQAKQQSRARAEYLTMDQVRGFQATLKTAVAETEGITEDNVPGHLAKATSHSEKIIRRLERDIFPWIGSRPVGEITAPELLSTLRRIEKRGAIETAHRAHQNCSQVFRYAIATMRAERDLSADLRGALPPAKERHHPSITNVKGVTRPDRGRRRCECHF